jgi:hypothetical protein
LLLFGIRKLRSTRKLVRGDAKNCSDDLKLQAFSKIFNKNLNLPLLDRFFKSHQINELFMHIGDEIGFRNIDHKYFTNYKIFEELSKLIFNI